MDNRELIRKLIESYKQNYTLYKKLNELVQKSLSTLVLSRGVVEGVMGLFAQKEALLKEIDTRRGEADRYVQMWKERKETIAESEDTRELDEILAKTQQEIASFLNAETQIQKYLEQAMRKGKNSE
jgi:succinate dehydrogenase flavin-adding protein (antitoxin of CptAB toxin-antitoxin module)